MMKVSEKISLQRLLVTFCVLVLLIAIYVYSRQHFFDLESEQFYAWLDSLGVWAPLFLIGLITLEVIIAPLPGGWLTIASGYLFGPWMGFAVSYIGMVLGSMVAFELARRLGQPFVKRLVKPDNYERYGEKLQSSQWGIILLYMIPLFPVDIISLLLGITSIHRKRFWIMMALGFLPNTFTLNFVGNAIAAPEYQFMIIGLTLAVVLYLIVRWYHVKQSAVENSTTTGHQ